MGKGFEVYKKLISEEKDLVTFEQIEADGEKDGIDVSKRMIRYYGYHGLLEKPIKNGRQVYYRSDYIYPAITIIFILKRKFCLPLGVIKKIMTANSKSVGLLLDKIQDFLERYKGKNLDYYTPLEQKFLDALTRGNLAVDFDKMEKETRGK